MCIAVSGELVEKSGSRGKVNVRGNILPVELRVVKAVVGDRLLIHAGCAISVITKDEDEELESLLNEIENYEH